MTRKLTIADPQALLNNMATVYTSLNRILMEYIDNSLDDAEKLLKDNGGKYPRPIAIVCSINRQKKEIAITDNCRGMVQDDLVGLVEQVGESKKKYLSWLNGQFGFGFQAFRVSNDEAEVTTRSATDGTWQMAVQSNTNDIEDEKRVPDKAFPHPTGTKVVLRGFESHWWKEASVNDLADEIELHFGPMLGRDKLEVMVEDGSKVRICRPFDMSLIPGSEFNIDIDKVTDTSGMTISFPLQPVQVRLKVADQPVPNRKPLFTNMGRRIDEVGRMTSFYNASAAKGKVWSHPNLTGYIEVNQNLSPMIDRADFTNTKKRSPLYKELVKVEEQIHKELAKIIKEASAENMDKLGKHLTKLLEDLAKEDRLLFRETATQVRAGGTEYEEAPEGGVDLTKIRGKHTGTGTAKEAGGETVKVKPGPGGLHGKPKRSAGFEIQFSDLSQDQLWNEETNKHKRSDLVEDTIFIYINNPDFKERVTRTTHGDEKLTERLANYVAAVIAGHYKNAFYEKHKLQPAVKKTLESRTDMFEDHLTFVCRLEDKLHPSVGLTLDKIGTV